MKKIDGEGIKKKTTNNKTQNKESKQTRPNNPRAKAVVTSGFRTIQNCQKTPTFNRTYEKIEGG